MAYSVIIKPKESLKNYFGIVYTCSGIVSVSWVGELLFIRGWQSSRDGVSMKILIPVNILSWHLEPQLCKWH